MYKIVYCDTIYSDKNRETIQFPKIRIEWIMVWIVRLDYGIAMLCSVMQH